MTDTSKGAVLKLLADVGTACAEYQNSMLRGLSCRRLQVDEIWAFCYAKERNVPMAMRGSFGVGDVWTFSAICADSKLVPSWLIGNRDAETATLFMTDLASRLANRVQLTTDGHRMYFEAVEEAFGANVNYAMLVKTTGATNTPRLATAPPSVWEPRRHESTAAPTPSTFRPATSSGIDLTMRMSMRRFTRHTNAFSKKVENLGHALGLHFMHYIFVRIHQTLRVTPAMEAVVTDRLWSVRDIAALLDSK